MDAIVSIKILNLDFNYLCFSYNNVLVSTHVVFAKVGAPCTGFDATSRNDLTIGPSRLYKR